MWGEAGCRDNPADILSRKCNHLNVKKINPVSTQTVHSGEIEVKYNRIQRKGILEHVPLRSSVLLPFYY